MAHAQYMRRGRGTAFRSAPQVSLPPDRDIFESLSVDPVKTLNKPSSTDIPEADIEVKDLVCIGSYNWVEAPQPTIIVPGSPREWLNKALPYTVQPDSGLSFVDQNGFRMPSAVLLPLLSAVDVVAEDKEEADFDWSTIDFVSDRNGLRKLLRWINDTDGTAREFRLDMQLAGKRTVLFNRWEKRTREGASGTFGFSFEKASTKPAHGCERGTGHHRIVKYDLDGLKLVVRFEVDACIPTEDTNNRGAPTTSNVDDLSDLLSGLAVSSTSSTSTSAPGASTTIERNGLKIISAGSLVPQSAVVELTTRSERNAANYDWMEYYPQLFLSQTPHHFLAIHSRGQFRAVQKKKLGSRELRDAARHAQNGLKKLRIILKTIQDLVVEQGQRGRLTLVCQDGVLKVYKRTSQDSCLSDELMLRFGAIF